MRAISLLNVSTDTAGLEDFLTTIETAVIVVYNGDRTFVNKDGILYIKESDFDNIRSQLIGMFTRMNETGFKVALDELPELLLGGYDEKQSM